MKDFHRPTLAVTALLVVGLFVVYHLTLGRKGK